MNAHERMLIAIQLDAVEAQLARQFGRKPQAPPLVDAPPLAQ